MSLYAVNTISLSWKECAVTSDDRNSYSSLLFLSFRRKVFQLYGILARWDNLNTLQVCRHFRAWHFRMGLYVLHVVYIMSTWSTACVAYDGYKEFSQYCRQFLTACDGVFGSRARTWAAPSMILLYTSGQSFILQEVSANWFTTKFDFILVSQRWRPYLVFMLKGLCCQYRCLCFEEVFKGFFTFNLIFVVWICFPSCLN